MSKDNKNTKGKKKNSTSKKGLASANKETKAKHPVRSEKHLKVVEKIKNR